MKPNGTIAKDIALYFIAVTAGRATPAIMKRTVPQAKSLLSAGYTKEEIIEVIDYLVNVKQVEMYSLGYVNVCINKVLSEIKKHKKEREKQERKQELKQQAIEQMKQDRNEVSINNDSTQRNRNKTDRFGTKSRKREESFSDLFERE